MSNPQHEPTMEEILASIRKIISEDSTDEKPAEPVVAAALEPAAEPESEDVLELTDELAEDSIPAPEPEIRPAPVFEKHDEIIFQSVEEEPAVEAAAAQPAFREEFEDAPADIGDGGIFSDKTRKALDDAFASIEPEDEPELEPVMASAPVSAAGRSVEAVFDRAIRESFDPVLRQWLGDNTGALIEGMKPVIRAWMDEHFPAMLEDAVRNEVARAAKARRR